MGKRTTSQRVVWDKQQRQQIGPRRGEGGVVWMAEHHIGRNGDGMEEWNDNAAAYLPARRYYV